MKVAVLGVLVVARDGAPTVASLVDVRHTRRLILFLRVVLLDAERVAFGRRLARRKAALELSLGLLQALLEVEHHLPQSFSQRSRLGRLDAVRGRVGELDFLGHSVAGVVSDARHFLRHDLFERAEVDRTVEPGVLFYLGDRDAVFGVPAGHALEEVWLNRGYL